MFKIVLAALAAALVLTVSASAGGGPKLSTFGTGHSFVNGDECAVFNSAGTYGGCYRKHTSNALLSKVHVSFTSLADNGGGAPRFSIPIDRNGDKLTDVYAFLDVNGCGNAFVSTDQSNCVVNMNDGSGPYANWAALAAAHPTWRVARKDDPHNATEPFIIADVQGDYLVTDVSLSY